MTPIFDFIVERTTARGATQGWGPWHALPTPVAFSKQGRLAYVSGPETVQVLSLAGGDVVAQVTVPRNMCALAFAAENALVGLAAPHLSDPPMLVRIARDLTVTTTPVSLPPVAGLSATARRSPSAMLFTGEARLHFGLAAPLDPSEPCWVATDDAGEQARFITALDGSAMLRVITRGGVHTTFVSAEPSGAAPIQLAEVPLTVDAAEWIDGRHIVAAGALDARFSPPRVLVGIDPVDGAERWRLGGAADARGRKDVSVAEWFPAGSARLPVRADRQAVGLLHRPSISAPACVSAISIDGQLLWTCDAPATAAFEWLRGGELVMTDLCATALHVVRGEVNACTSLSPLPEPTEDLDSIVSRLEVSPDHSLVVLSRVESWTERITVLDATLLSGILT